MYHFISLPSGMRAEDWISFCHLHLTSSQEWQRSSDWKYYSPYSIYPQTGQHRPFPCRGHNAWIHHAGFLSVYVLLRFQTPQYSLPGLICDIIWMLDVQRKPGSGIVHQKPHAHHVYCIHVPVSCAHSASFVCYRYIQTKIQSLSEVISVYFCSSLFCVVNTVHAWPDRVL